MTHTGCSHIAPPLVRDTWPDNLKNQTYSKLPSLNDRADLDRVCCNLIKAINSARLDTLAASQCLQGEAAIEGNSLLAGNQELAGFYPVKALASSPEDIIFPSENTAVAMVKQGASPHYSYLFFRKSLTWKLTAIRTPCWNRTTADLSLKPDKFLISWFNNNKKQLMALEPLLLGATDISIAPVYAQPDMSLAVKWQKLLEVAYQCPNYLPTAISELFARSENADLEYRLKKLGFESASQWIRTFNSILLRQAPTFDGNFYLKLPSPNCSNTFFIYSPREQQPPVSPNGFIWLKKLDTHWYLARSAS